MKTRSLAVLALVALVPVSGPGAAAPAKTAPAKAAVAAGHAASTVPWIADDYTRALAEAKARRVPLFIEAWAPW